MEIKEKTGGRWGSRAQVASGRELTCADNHFLYAFLQEEHKQCGPGRE